MESVTAALIEDKGADRRQEGRNDTRPSPTSTPGSRLLGGVCS